MAAYLIADIARVVDEQAYGRYKQQVSPGLLAAGGRYLARGGPIEHLEGDWRPNRLILVRFDSAQLARSWWASKEYAPLKDMRRAATHSHMIIVDGLPEESAP
jgi:uncharacterized protein (DUF1330 family)